MSFSEKHEKLKNLSNSLANGIEHTTEPDFDSAINRIYYSVILCLKEMVLNFKNKRADINIQFYEGSSNTHTLLKEDLKTISNLHNPHITSTISNSFETIKGLRKKADYDCDICQLNDWTQVNNCCNKVLLQIDTLKKKFSL